MTEDVSSVAAEWCLRDVDGEDVEMSRRDCLDNDEFDVVNVECFDDDFARVGDDDEPKDLEVEMDDRLEGDESGLCCVCILVLTTSRGQVITPAMPPADAPVKISSPKPMSLWPTHAFAIFCSCS
jgi:hypothetical protein